MLCLAPRPQHYFPLRLQLLAQVSTLEAARGAAAAGHVLLHVTLHTLLLHATPRNHHQFTDVPDCRGAWRCAAFRPTRAHTTPPRLPRHTHAWNAPLLLSSSRKVGKRNYKPDARRYNSSELPPCFRLLCGCSLGPTTRGVRISLFSSWLRRLLSPAGAGAVRLVRPASPPTPHSPQPTSFNFPSLLSPFSWIFL